ncbi:MAG: SpoIID/LytB domain-containing protein [Cyanobacteria bacterium P01_F01_bin.53]
MAAQTSAAQTSAFAKNWLLRLASAQPSPASEKTTGQATGLKWGLRCLGGCLLWLVLVLPAQAAVELRVAISQGNDAISIGSSTTGIIRDGSGQALYQLPELQGITVEEDATEVDLTNGSETLAESSAFWLEPSDNGFVWIGDKWYRGRVMVTLSDGELTAVNYVDLEDYLYSVVGSEMPTSWPQAALQSQAVAARSYALYKRARTRNPLFDVDATTTYQAYKGLQQEHPNTIAAVDSTESQVVTHNGQVIEAIFHSSSGGYTENAGEVWSNDVPYLQGVEDFDQSAPVYRWEEMFSLEEFSDKIGDIGTIHTIGDPQLTTRGRVASIIIEGDEGTKTLRGRDIRSALRLRSTRFSIEIDEDTEQVTIAGYGFGHGVGMSQWGARSLAEQGWSFDQILQHYYQSTVVAQLEG